MTAFLVTAWMVSAAIGGGLVVLRISGVLSSLRMAERLAFAFVLGTGLIGWLVFFPGVVGAYKPVSFAVVLAALSAGLVYVRTPTPEAQKSAAYSAIEWLLILGIGVVMLMDFCEALAPAADGDTMAYHFESPRRFLAGGVLYAIPRAVDGVTQLLLQMTYGTAMGLGGKSAPPLWTMVSGWGLGAIFYVIARRHMDRIWALAGTLALISAPAVIYGAGSGQVEVRVASFALLSAYAAAISLHDDTRRQTGWAIVAGIAAGFFAGSKMTGLLFCLVTCLALAGERGALKRMAVFSCAAALAGVQWYIFNWQQTGDPLYPMLWRHLDLAPGYPWDQGVAAQLARLWAAERPLPSSLGWFFAYPFRTIIDPISSFESLRTGIGPLVLVLLPFALVAFSRTRNAPRSPLFRLLILAFAFYALWYILGPSLRVRHLVPVYPLVLLCVLTGAAKFMAGRVQTGRILCAGVALVLAVQIAGQAVFSKKFASYLLSDTTSAQYYAANISGYESVDWLNKNLRTGERVLVLNREWLYLLDVPYFFAHPTYQTQVSIYQGAADMKLFISQLRNLDITHIAVQQTQHTGSGIASIDLLLDKLAAAGCAKRITNIDSRSISSRTLPQLGRALTTFTIFAIEANKCRLS